MASLRRTRVAHADRVRSRSPFRRGEREGARGEPSIATTRWCWRSVRCRPIRKSRRGLLADAWLARGPRDEDTRLLRRLRFAGHDVDVDALVRAAAYGARDLERRAHRSARSHRTWRAPSIGTRPSRSSCRADGPRALEYHEDGSVSASVKLQELFGLAETPRVGRQREAVVLALLAPNGRPVQVTRDLRSFWDRTYPEVRKELRGRYPKHPWPEDPWTAPPTARTNR